jgi:hypothetical protein
MARLSRLDLDLATARRLRAELQSATTEELVRVELGPCQVLPKKYREKSGYGRWKIGEEIYRAHRLMYVLINGMIPDDMVVMHRCDNPPCVRIEHLKYGTIQDNNADRHEKGRTLKGQNAPGAKLTEKEVLVAYKLVTEYGVSGRKVAGIFEVHHKTVQRLLAGVKWQSLGLKPWTAKGDK